MDEKRIEEALSIIWEIQESQLNQNEPLSVEKVVTELTKQLDANVYQDLISFGDIVVIPKAFGIAFTPVGYTKAKNIIRRQRLAERLLVDILDRPQSEITSDACEFEHIISPGVEESICILLGHPRECPHGSPIPEGACCLRVQDKVESVVISLDRLGAGEIGRVAYMLTRDHPQMHRLMNFGVVPGTIIRVHQTYPSLVIQLGETQVAMENDTAEVIFVRRIKR